MLMDGWESHFSFSKITCPQCGHQKTEKMPSWMHSNRREIIYECEGCGATLTPEPKDCCVFCSYGSVPCLPSQADQNSSRRPKNGWFKRGIFFTSG